MGLLRYNVFGCSFFPRPAFGTWEDSGFHLALFSPLTYKQPFYHLFILKSVVFRNFPLGFPFCQHGFDFWQQRLYVCVIPLLHDKTP